ncbi:hypothetical protein CKU38_02198 [Xanthomonas citri pv. fuscans]|nr:hypothetical protein CKU38_02198 [Xanthomonas citri pv. fuscans]
MRVAAAALARCGSDNAATAAVPEMRKWRRPASAGCASNGSIRTPAGEGMQPGGRMRALARHVRHAQAAQGHCRQRTDRCMRQVERVMHEADCTRVRSAPTSAECDRFARCAGRHGRSIKIRTALAAASSKSGAVLRSSITSPNLSGAARAPHPDSVEFAERPCPPIIAGHVLESLKHHQQRWCALKGRKRDTVFQLSGR